jgi:hypothetical protein
VRRAAHRPGSRCSSLQSAISETELSGRGKAGIAFPSGEVVGRVQAGGARRYYLKDHLGSIRAVLDGSGNAAERRGYYPFGLPMPGRCEKGSPPTQEDFTRATAQLREKPVYGL